MADLRTTYLGLPLAHPVVASASPLSKSLDGVRRLEDGGAAAIVLASLFEEQIRQEQEMLERLTALGADSHGEAAGYFPSMPGLEAGPDAYLELVTRARRAVSVPVVASLNGSTPSGWVRHAALLEQAGADAIELNVFFVPADLSLTGRDVERRCEQVVRAVCEAVTIPVAVKVAPFFSAMGDMARRFVAAGARGLVLFNRFYQPDFDPIASRSRRRWSSARQPRSDCRCCGWRSCTGACRPRSRRAPACTPRPTPSSTCWQVPTP